MKKADTSIATDINIVNSTTDTIVLPSDKTTQLACSIWASGGLVAIPTETVYGLGADSTNADAVMRIYAVKSRPAFNPLISHISSIEMLKTIANINGNDVALQLLSTFSGITLVLTQTDNCPVAKIACAGLDTIAVRIPNNPYSRALIESYGTPIVAPSANKSGHISPTSAIHVQNSLGDKVDLIIDGGNCVTGLESTIIDVSTGTPYLLRAGTITNRMIEDTLNITLTERTFAKGNNPIAPGQLKSHYAPDMPVYINIETPNPNHAYLGFGNCGDCTLNLSPSGNLSEAGKNLFDYLHQLNDSACIAIDVAPIPNIDIGIAINDKLVRASSAK